MLSDMLTRHLVTMFLIFLFSIMLRNRKSSRDTEQRYFPCASGGPCYP